MPQRTHVARTGGLRHHRARQARRSLGSSCWRRPDTSCCRDSRERRCSCSWPAPAAGSSTACSRSGSSAHVRKWFLICETSCRQSFPSGHALTSAVVYLTLGALLMRVVAGRRHEVLLSGGGDGPRHARRSEPRCPGRPLSDRRAGRLDRRALTWALVCWTVERRSNGPPDSGRRAATLRNHRRRAERSSWQSRLSRLRCAACRRRVPRRPRVAVSGSTPLQSARPPHRPRARHHADDRIRSMPIDRRGARNCRCRHPAGCLDHHRGPRRAAGAGGRPRSGPRDSSR